MNWQTRLVVIGLVVALPSVAGAFARAQGTTARAVVVLSATNGTCGKTLIGNDGTDATARDRIRTRRGGVVQWTVVNNCDASATVGVIDWVRKSSRRVVFPFEPNGRTSCTAASGQQCVLTLTVRSDAAPDTYSYGVSVNGATQDPDIIIED